MEVNKEKIRYILQFFFDKGENASQVAEIVNGVYGSADTVTANYVQFWFRRFRLVIFDVKFAPRPNLSKVEFKKKLDVWVQHQLTPKHMIVRICICEALAKRNEIDLFLKWMVTGDEKWVTYNNTVRSWSKRGEAAQTVAKPGLASRKVLLYIWWDWKDGAIEPPNPILVLISLSLGRGSLVVKVEDSRLACHEFEHSTAEYSSCRGARWTLNMWTLKRPSAGMLWKSGDRGANSGVVFVT
ncbi:putative DD34D transposase [Trichonephila clavipes]|nr:putative DD34D transposase [Trichonephila clavipes]